MHTFTIDQKARYLSSLNRQLKENNYLSTKTLTLLAEKFGQILDQFWTNISDTSLNHD